MAMILFEYEGNYFIIHPNTPLKKYYADHYDLTTDYNMVKSWGRSSVVFAEYGQYLIKENPLSYVRGFILINIKNYFLPPLNNFRVYNRDKDEIWPLAQNWFDWKTSVMTAVSKSIQEYILFIFPPLFLFLNGYILVTVLLLLFRRQLLRENRPLARIIVLLLSFLAVNFGFTVFAAMNILRYQLVSMAAALVCTLLLMELFRDQHPPQYNSAP